MIAYAKGARTFECHIDLEADGISVSPCRTLPDQCDVWFRAFKKAKEMRGASGTQERLPGSSETEYLGALLRGVYAACPLESGHELAEGDYSMAIPLRQGQLSCRELVAGEISSQPVAAGRPLTLDSMDAAYSRHASKRARIDRRGVPMLVNGKSTVAAS